MKKKLWVLVLFSCLTLMLAACSDDKKTAGEKGGKAAEQVLKIANDQEPAGLDPHKTPAASSVRIYSQIYEGLVTFDKDMKVVGQLAEKWEQPDDKTYVFTLRKGVTFHNGREMTAEDVKYSFERILAEETASHIKSYFANVKTVEATDPQTVKFTLSKTDATFLANLTHSSAVVVAKETVEEKGDLQQTAVGTGPFKLDKWVPDNNVTLLKNEDYYMEGTPKLDSVIYYTMKEESARMSGIRTGEIDFTTVSAKSAELLEKSDDIELMPYQSLEYSYVGFNVKNKPLSDEKVRQALSLATDRQAIADIVWDGDAVISGPVAPSMGDWAIDVTKEELYQKNNDKAKQLLAEAGYPDGFEIVITTASTYPDMVDTAQLLQQQWKEIGVKATIKQIEWGDYIDTWSNKKADILIGRNGSGTDPDRALNYFFHSTGSANVWNFADSKYDSIVEKGKETVDEAKRKEIYTEAQKELLKLSPNLFLVSPENFVAVRKNVEGFTPYPHNAQQITGVSKK